MPGGRAPCVPPRPEARRHAATTSSHRFAGWDLDVPGVPPPRPGSARRTGRLAGHTRPRGRGTGAGPSLDMAARPWLTPAARAYRQLLTSQRQLFGQDRNALVQARDQTRTQFLQNADAEPDAVPALLQDARDAADFLRENVAQTVRSEETGNFGAQTYRSRSTAPHGGVVSQCLRARSADAKAGAHTQDQQAAAAAVRRIGPRAAQSRP